MLSILGFLIILGPLVLVHEFGHYIFARVFKVKAEIFSLGFGPRLWSKQLGETELRVSAIPLGGYVKLLGEEGEEQLSPQDRERALTRQAPWKRFFIFFGGPLFNFLFAIVIFMAILAIGEPQMASIVGRVVSGSQAERVGFQSGDKIIAIDGKPVKKFEEIVLAINENPQKKMSFEVIHPQSNQVTTLSAIPSAQEGFSIYGEATQVGEIEGLLATARATQVGVSDPHSLAAQVGFHTGDRISEWNGVPVKTWEEIERAFQQAPLDGGIKVKFQTTQSKIQEALFKKTKTTSLGDAFGLYSSELFIEKTVPKSPAEQAGIQSGDRLLGVGKNVVSSFFELKEAVQKAGEKEGKVPIRWERNGKIMSAVIVPTATSIRNPILKKSNQYTIGVIPILVWAEPTTVVERVWNPVTLVFKASERMAVFSWRNLVSLRKMFTGDVSVATLGGPILIGKIAGESLARGLIAFLTTMAILSVGLGILNVLPIPVLDGGHLMLLAIETIRGKPLTIRQMEIVQQVGLSLILLLMVIVIRNDLARLPFFE